VGNIEKSNEFIDDFHRIVNISDYIKKTMVTVSRVFWFNRIEFKNVKSIENLGNPSG